MLFRSKRVAATVALVQPGQPDRTVTTRGEDKDLNDIARLEVPYAQQGKPLEVKGKTVKGPAIAHTLPFDDPEKKKRTAVG